MSPPLSRCLALVLRHSDYGEADRIVSLLTPEHGLQRGFARAARKSRKRFGAGLEPLSLVVVHWRQGRGDLWSLQETELLDAHRGIRQNLTSLAFASYASELVELLLEQGDVQPQIYLLLISFLNHLDQGGDPATARLLFELRLVALLGYLPHLLHCSLCHQGFSAERVSFNAARGGSLCAQCADSGSIPIEAGTLGTLSRSLQLPIDRFDGFRFGQQTCQEGGAALAQVLALILPREPKSLKFLAQL